jgi:uncharacterized membrane protein (UPF0127 family)
LNSIVSKFQCILFYLFTISILQTVPATANPEFNFRSKQLTISTISGDHIFNVELAETTAQRRYGLQYRKSLSSNTGMLFVFETIEPITMWMKNTFISLDMLFLSSNGKIVKIVHRTKPLSLNAISSKVPAKRVLEINAGVAKRLKISVGDMTYISSFRN